MCFILMYSVLNTLSDYTYFYGVRKKSPGNLPTPRMGSGLGLELG